METLRCRWPFIHLHQECLHFAFALDCPGTTSSKHAHVTQLFGNGIADMYCHWEPAALHAGGNIDCITHKAVARALQADHP